MYNDKKMKRGANMSDNQLLRKRIIFYGRVQGVGFRYTAFQAAREAKATGWVRNEFDGSVTMEIQGREEQIDRVLQTMQSAKYIRINRMECQTINPVADEKKFGVR